MDINAKIAPHSILKQRCLLIQWGFSCCIFASHPSKRGWATPCKQASKQANRQTKHRSFWMISNDSWRWSLDPRAVKAQANKQKRLQILHICVRSNHMSREKKQTKKHTHRQKERQTTSLCISTFHPSKTRRQHACMHWFRKFGWILSSQSRLISEIGFCWKIEYSNVWHLRDGSKREWGHWISNLGTRKDIGQKMFTAKWCWKMLVVVNFSGAGT